MLLLSDPRIAAIPIDDCGEGLVDVAGVPELAVELRKPEPAGSWLRSGIVERLQRAQCRLPADTRLLIIEGHRPAAQQRALFDGHRAALAAINKTWTGSRLDTEASKYVSPPSVAPHPCGAAVDLTLIRNGREVDMGTPVNATPEQSNNACFTNTTTIGASATAARRLLGEVLTAEGFINYPTEWWHWSFGDRYWAAVTGAPSAVYGPR